MKYTQGELLGIDVMQVIGELNAVDKLQKEFQQYRTAGALLNATAVHDSIAVLAEAAKQGDMRQGIFDANKDLQYLIKPSISDTTGEVLRASEEATKYAKNITFMSDEAKKILDPLQSPSAQLMAEYERIGADSLKEHAHWKNIFSDHERLTGLRTVQAQDFEPKEFVVPYSPPDFGRSMFDVMEESDKKQEHRHRQQVAIAERLAVAAEESSKAARDAERSAQESLDLTRRSLRNSRIANWIAFGALVATVLVYLLGLPS